MDMEAIGGYDPKDLFKRRSMKIVTDCPLCGDCCGVDGSGIPRYHLSKCHRDINLEEFSAQYKGKMELYEKAYTEEELRKKEWRRKERERDKERRKRMRCQREANAFERLARNERSIIDPLMGKTLDDYSREVAGEMQGIMEKVCASVPEWDKAGVTNEEKQFCALYVTNGFNATAAFSAIWGSAHTVVEERLNGDFSRKRGIGMDTTPTLFLQRPNVQKLINLFMESWMGVKANELNFRLTETLFRMAFYDPAELMAPDGSPRFKTWDEVPPELRCCIKKIRTVCYGSHAEARIVEMELIDRMDALRVMTKYAVAMKEGLREGLKKANSTMTPETELMLRSLLDEGRKVSRRKGSVEITDESTPVSEVTP